MTIRLKARRTGTLIAFAAAATLTLAACSGGGTTPTPTTSGTTGTTTPAEGGATEFSRLDVAENGTTQPLLDAMAQNQCKAENDALPVTQTSTPSADMAARIQLLAGQDALPVWYPGDTTNTIPGGDLNKAGFVLDLEKALTDVGAWDQVTPIAKSVMSQIYSGAYVTMPVQFNIEGIFYNKKIFADNNIAVPTTLDELKAAAEKLKAAGVTPIVAAGATSWTINRWLGAMLFSEIGPNALKDVQDGKAKLTDPAYVAVAQQLQDLGPYFVKGLQGIDYDTMNSQMLNGKAAMMYMGTWFLANVNDPAQNKIGDDMGFFKFPGIEGYPANVGGPNIINAKLYNSKVGAWLKCIAENIGSDALKTQGVFSGFKVNTPVEGLSPITKEIQADIDSAPSAVLWLEALWTPKARADAGDNIAAMVTGGMTPIAFMTQVQADLDAGQ